MRVGVLKGYPTPTPLKPPFLALSHVARTCGSACLALLARGCTTSLRGCARGRRQPPSLLLRLYPSGPRIPPALGSLLGARPGSDTGACFTLVGGGAGLFRTLLSSL